MRRLAAALLALTLAGPLAATSAGPTEALATSGARLSEAVAALGALGAPAGPAGVAALVTAITAQENALEAMRDDVIGAESRERDLAFDMQRRQPEIARLLLALEALGRSAAPASGLHPDGPLGAARAAAMRDALAPALRAEAVALGDRLVEIDEVRELRAGGLEDLAIGLGDLAAAREALLAALAMDDQAAAPLSDAIPPALPREAESLSDLAGRLAALGGAGAVPADAAPLALRWPVAGRPLRGFGAPDAAGVRRPGLLLQAPPLALVTAPAAGEVRYAGPFLDYGYVVVIEPRADTLIVLAGLAMLETRTGAVVSPGALLGLLGGRPIDAQEYLMLGRTQTGETPAETLYIELRQGQGPVDPSAWFTDRNG